MDRAWLWSALCLALASPAAAQQPPHVVEANQRVREGERLFERGDYDAALAEFERAYEVIGAHPNRYLILYNIGQAHERRFRYDLAMRYYRRYLDEGGASAEDRGEVEAKIASLEGLLATLHVRVNRPAEVWMDNRQIGEAPGDVLVPGGRHVIEVRAHGYAPERREIQVAPRTEQALSFTLASLSGGLDPLYFALAAAAAGVCALTGAALGTTALLVRADIDNRLNGPDSAALMYTVTSATLAEIQAIALATDIFFGAALLFGATAVVLALLTDFGGSAPPEQARVAPWVSPHGGGLAAEVRF